MTYSLRFRPEVAQDLRGARDWYESRVAGLGTEFMAEFWAATDRLIERPLSFAASSSGLRTCRLRRFSYLIHFRLQGDEILVIAVMNAARDASAFDHRG